MAVSGTSQIVLQSIGLGPMGAIVYRPSGPLFTNRFLLALATRCLRQICQTVHARINDLRLILHRMLRVCLLCSWWPASRGFEQGDFHTGVTHQLPLLIGSQSVSDDWSRSGWLVPGFSLFLAPPLSGCMPFSH